MFKRYKTFVDSKVNTAMLQKAVQTEIKMADMDENKMANNNAHDTGVVNKPEVNSNPLDEEIDKRLEPLWKAMASYKDLYKAGEMLPANTYLEFYYANINTKEDSIEYQDMMATRIGDKMVQYQILELYKKHLDFSTYQTWLEKQRTEHCIVLNLTNMSSNSKQLVQRMLELGYIEWYVQQILNNQKFLENYTEDKNIEFIVSCSVLTVFNCASHNPNHPVYKEQHLAQVLQPYMSSKVMSIRTTAYMLLSSIISEDENSKLEDSDCIPFMVNGVHEAVHNQNREYAIPGDTNFTITELLECLVRIAANDSNKIKLVEAGLLPEMLLSMQEGGVKEQEMAAQLTWNLCFSESAKEKVMTEEGYIEQLEKLTKSENKLVKKAANGALWKIHGEQSHTDQRLKTPDIDQEKHIFISYQWDNQDVILQINDRLKADGYRTWIDVEQMGGSTLDAMAGAVEHAYLVLISASEKYKLSPNCRTEAEYTFQTKKPIVPLMMQRHYKADGWLGMLMGAKLYVNFDGKYEFEEAYKMLIKEMSPYLMAAARKESSEDGTKVVPQAAPKFYKSPPALKPAPPREPAASAWSHKQVLDWAHKYKLTQLNLKFQNLLDNMDGPHLVQLARMDKRIPEAFYKLVSETYELDTLDYLQLTRALADIRENIL